jgi:hypothetical protein
VLNFIVGIVWGLPVQYSIVHLPDKKCFKKENLTDATY